MANPLQTETERLVRAARVGDQNAMATISMIAKSAKLKSRQAMMAHNLIQKYIETHPVPQSSMGSEATTVCGVLMTCKDDELIPWIADLVDLGGRDTLLAATIIIANGEPLNNPRITAIADSVPSSLKKMFNWGVVFSGNMGNSDRVLKSTPKLMQGAAFAGQCIGMAQKLQAVRAGAPISRLSESAGWEHGE